MTGWNGVAGYLGWLTVGVVDDAMMVDVTDIGSCMSGRSRSCISIRVLVAIAIAADVDAMLAGCDGWVVW